MPDSPCISTRALINGCAPGFALAAAVLALATWAGSAAAFTSAAVPRGAWSVGAQGAYAILSMGDLNANIHTSNSILGTRFEDLKHGWEGALDVRYAFRDGLFVGAEGGYLRGRTEDQSGEAGRIWASAVPLQVIGGGAVGRPTQWSARVVVGIGVLVAGKFEALGRSATGVGFLTSLGGEVEYRVAPSLALAGQALVRQAKVSKPDNLDYDVDFTGASFRLGVRGYFGGRRS